jgi:hypothetical protein
MTSEKASGKSDKKSDKTDQKEAATGESVKNTEKQKTERKNEQAVTAEVPSASPAGAEASPMAGVTKGHVGLGLLLFLFLLVGTKMFVPWFSAAQLILVLTAAVMLGAILALWTSVRRLTGEIDVSPELAGIEMRVIAPREQKLERKRALLRALKDLEHETAVGKLSRDDWDEVAEAYREEAKQLMQELDADLEPYRKKAEEHLAAALAESPSKPAAKQKGATSVVEDHASGDAEDDDNDEDDDDEDDESKASTSAVVCGACKTSNDADAKFCKGCGAGLSLKGNPA